MLEKVVRWSLGRPRLIGCACLWFLAWGSFYVRDLKLELLPNLAPAEVSIQTEAPGLVAEQVETLVSRPVEAALIGAAGVAHVHSDSVQGLSIVTVDFPIGADPNRARQSVSESLGAITGLPAGVAQPRVAPLTARDAEVMQIGFSSPSLDPMALRDIVQWTVRPRLLSASGVAKVAVYGGQTRRIEVRARPADLSDSDLGFLDIINAVKRAISVAGAGFIDTDSQRVLIEPRGQALTAADVGAGQIQTPGAAAVRIEDVSDVSEAAAPALGDALIDGKPAVVAIVSQQFGANRLQTTRALEREVAILAPALASRGVMVHPDLDRPATSDFAELEGVGADLVVGVAMVFLALLVAMRDPRAVLVSFVSIPLSFLAALVALKALGLGLNLMTLGGMVVGLGVVIDDAVIDVDSILSRLREAELGRAARAEAILAASIEVRAPVIYATLGVIVAVSPLLVLRGTQQALLAPLAVTVIAVALASLAAAIAITPSLCLLFLTHVGPARARKPSPGLARLDAAWASGLEARPRTILAVALVVVLLAFAGALAFKGQFIPPQHDGHLIVDLSAPSSTGIAVMRVYGAGLARDLKAIDGVLSISERIGRDATGDDGWGPERGQLDIALRAGLDGADQERAAARVRTTLASYPGLETSVHSRFDLDGQGAGGPSGFRVTLYGQDLEATNATANSIARILRRLPGSAGVRTEDQPRAPVVRADLDFQRLALYGLSAADVLETVQAAFAGEEVARIYQGDRVIDLAVSAQAELRRDPEGVGALLLRSTSGISVPLSAVANVYLTDAPAQIDHDDGLRRQVITASPSDPVRFERLARDAISKGVISPPGAFMEFGGSGQEAAAALSDLWINYGFAIFAVLALLAVAFDGRTGGLILGSTLISLAGGVASLHLIGGALSVGASLGFIALLGLSLRNAILIFGRLEDLVLTRRAHWSMATILLAVRERIGPLLFTALLVALALAPLALQGGDPGREILGPMAVVILGGLISGTIGSVIVLPALIQWLWRPAYARRARRPRPHDAAPQVGQ